MIENVFLILYLIFLAPKLLINRLKGKRHPAIMQRLGFSLPKPDRPVIWIHAVSVGEVKAAQPLFEALKTDTYYFFITTTTATGQAEAKRSLKGADAYGYLPIDLTWVVRRFVKTLKPHHFILVESDFWPNLLTALKKNGTKISLVSGKISERSANRFLKIPFFSRRLFSCFDHLCVQNEEYFQRFAPFTSRVQITGNLKLDLVAQPVTKRLELSQPVITVSCTHFPEEEWILDALEGREGTLFLAPRHPERFKEVAELLDKRGMHYTRWSKNQMSKLVLIDAMGQLPICYAHSRLAILGGSFVNHVGGHNVLEPCLYGTPVIFGPYMHEQTEFAQRALDSIGGAQIPINQLRRMVERFFSDRGVEEKMREGALNSIEAGRGATARTLKIILNGSSNKSNRMKNC